MRALAATTAALSAMIAAPAAGQSWQAGSDADGGYGFCYPAAVLKAQPQKAGSDVRWFAGPNGAAMRIVTHANPDGQSLSERMARASMPATDPDPMAYPRINYRRLYDDYFIATGNTRDEDSFEKTYLADGAFLTLQITFPQADAAKWRPLVKRISACFKPME